MTYINEMIEHAQQERGGFTGSGLRLPDGIAPGHQHWNECRLNRRWGGVPAIHKGMT